MEVLPTQPQWRRGPHAATATAAAHGRSRRSGTEISSSNSCRYRCCICREELQQEICRSLQTPPEAQGALPPYDFSAPCSAEFSISYLIHPKAKSLDPTKPKTPNPRHLALLQNQCAMASTAFSWSSRITGFRQYFRAKDLRFKGPPRSPWNSRGGPRGPQRPFGGPPWS